MVSVEQQTCYSMHLEHDGPEVGSIIAHFMNEGVRNGRDGRNCATYTSHPSSIIATSFFRCTKGTAVMMEHLMQIKTPQKQLESHDEVGKIMIAITKREGTIMTSLFRESVQRLFIHPSSCHPHPPQDHLNKIFAMEPKIDAHEPYGEYPAPK